MNDTTKTSKLMVIFQQMQPFSTDINFDRRFSQGCPGFRTAAGGFALTETLEGTLTDSDEYLPSRSEDSASSHDSDLGVPPNETGDPPST